MSIFKKDDTIKVINFNNNRYDELAKILMYDEFSNSLNDKEWFEKLSITLNRN
jgi:hypothetical protein